MASKTVSLGEALAKSEFTSTPQFDGFFENLISEIRREVTSGVLTEFRTLLVAALTRLQSSPSVPTVPVHVPTPEITVDVAPAKVDVELMLPGFAEYTAQLRIVSNLLGNVVTLLSTPVTTEIERDGYQNIVRTTQKRG